MATPATARPPGGLAACCPKGKQAGQRVVQQEKLPARSVTTRFGKIQLRRQR